MDQKEYLLNKLGEKLGMTAPIFITNGFKTVTLRGKERNFVMLFFKEKAVTKRNGLQLDIYEIHFHCNAEDWFRKVVKEKIEKVFPDIKTSAKGQISFRYGKDFYYGINSIKFK